MSLSSLLESSLIFNKLENIGKESSTQYKIWMIKPLS